MTVVDRRFGAPRKFGTSTKFGPSTSDSFFAWGVEVDWDGDYQFDGTNEARYMTSISVFRGRKRQIKSTGQGFENLSVGKLSIELRNIDGRYDGWNTASPLYPNVIYGREISVTVRDWATGTIEPVFYGVISDIVPTGYGKDAKVVITADDGWSFLRNYTARVALQQAIGPERAIGKILDSVAWPDRWGRTFSVSSDSIPYWWTSGDKKAASEIEDITESFFGNFFVSASGAAVYKLRTTVDAIAANFPQEYILKDIANPQPWVNSRNVVRIKVHPRTASSETVLYQLIGTQPSINSGAENEYSIFGQYMYNNQAVPALSIVTPAATTDYLMNTSPGGSGTDKTADCTVTATNFGDTVKLRIRNNSGGTVYITKLQVRGIAIYELNSSDVQVPNDTSGIQQPREFVLDQRWLQDVNVAIDSAGVLSTYFGQRNPYPVIQIENRFEYQFGLELFDTTTTSLTKLGISGNSYKIGGIEHKSYGDTCQKIVTKFYLEPYPFSGEYWSWDTRSVFGTDVFGA